MPHEPDHDGRPLVWAQAGLALLDDAPLRALSLSLSLGAGAGPEAGGWDWWRPEWMKDAPLASVAQVALGVGIGVVYVAGRVSCWRPPRWCRPFAREEAWQKGGGGDGDGDGDGDGGRAVAAGALALLSAVGLALAVGAAVVASSGKGWRGLEVVPWSTCVVMTVLDRPRKTPLLLLGLYVGMAVCGLAALARAWADGAGLLGAGVADRLRVTEVLVAGCGVVVMMCMPMRDGRLPTAGIAGRGDGATSALRSPEDNMSLAQFMTVSWMSALIRVGSVRKLQDEDVWALPYDFQHGRLLMLFRDLTGSLTRRLLLANGLDLIIIVSITTLETLGGLANPILLQRLLLSIEKGAAHRGESVGWASAILLLRYLCLQADVVALWFCRRAYERSRGEMITAIYAKTLTRKCQGAEAKAEEDVDGKELGQDTGKGLMGRLTACFQRNKTVAAKEGRRPATMGKILNLMKNDCYEVAQRFWDSYRLVSVPLQLVVSLVLVWKLLGWPSLLGIGWVVLLQLVNAGVVGKMLKQQYRQREATDSRLQATSHLVEAIRHLRYYDWQSSWLARMMESRERELHERLVSALWSVLSSSINVAAAVLFPVVSFYAYTLLAGRSLPVNVAFPALVLFDMLRQSLTELPEVVTTLINASVAMSRLESFMAEPDKEEGFANDAVAHVEFRNATLAWPGTARAVLSGLNLHFSTGLHLICGRVGSGKSALLQGILGELDAWSGESLLPTDMVGYCAQQPWLQNMTIRDNILFSTPYDAQRYQHVLDCCALMPDLAAFRHGDLTDIGESGVGLSGGQKARVALARAVYSHSRILLLDDPLAPLDHHTAQSIVLRLLQGPLVEGRTVLLVTNRVELCVGLADQVVEMYDGKARVLPSTDGIVMAPEVANGPAQGEELSPASAPAPAPASRTDELTDQQTEEQTDEETDPLLQSAAVPDKFMQDEVRAEGGVMGRVYWTYIRAGHLRWWVLVALTYAMQQLANMAKSWFLKSWAESYDSDELGLVVNLLGGPVSVSVSALSAGRSLLSSIFDGLPDPTQHLAPWLLCYLAIALGQVLLYTGSYFVSLVILFTAARALFVRVMNKVTNATFRFYDVTPVGRLMNRLTSDMGKVDGGIIAPLQQVAFYGLNWVICLAAIALTTPVFCAFAIAMTVGFIIIFARFLPTSQSLRRLEMVSLSPLMSNFGILVHGLATIRAFKAQTHFQQRNIAVTDAFQKMDHFYWSLQAWLTYRTDMLSALSTFIMTMMALYSGLSSGLTAFVLNAASWFVSATHMLCKGYGQLQMDFVAVERVVELLDLEEEQNGVVEPPADWPGYGDDIVFDKVTTRYAPHLDPSLRDATFTIPAGSTCAVLGRTGSGKSTMALALLATLRPEQGRILVGGLDLATVNVHTWRQRVSFVAQDPQLFPGSLRHNVDPLGEHSEAECAAVLRRVLGPGWSPAAMVEGGGGKNLSQGQRQLVGIARAVLRRSAVVLLDEATASIDVETARAIHDVLRDELAASTVITIAHRLDAVKDADYFLRLDGGAVVGCGPAAGAGAL